MKIKSKLNSPRPLPTRSVPVARSEDVSELCSFPKSDLSSLIDLAAVSAPSSCVGEGTEVQESSHPKLLGMFSDMI